MIYLYCASIPDDLSLSDTAERIKVFWGGESNSEYIENIRARSHDRAAEGLFSLLLLLKMINRHFPAHSANQDLTLARNENGKPFFKDSVLDFSISHSNGIVACALSDSGEVGIDIEAAILTPEKIKKLSSRYFCADEAAEIDDDPEKFVSKWTEKEAITKFFGANLADFIKKSDNELKKHDFLLHRFKYCRTPITLCTKRDFDKIIFCDLDC